MSQSLFMARGAFASVVACIAAVAASPATHARQPDAPFAMAAAATAPNATAPTLSAIGAELARSRRGEDVAIAAFYERRGGAPFWAEAGRGAALADALASAPDHALPAVDPNLVTAATRTITAEVEIALTRAYLAHARALSTGLLEPRAIDEMIKRRVARPEPATLLAMLETAPDIARHLARLAPADPDYATLQARYAELRRLPAADMAPRLGAGPTLRPGDRGPRVAALRARLDQLGLRPAGPVADPASFDASLEAAVRRFQNDAGLNQDGLVGPMTRAAIDVGPAEQQRKLAVNLERLRWTNQPLAPRHIIVNQADFSVRLVDGDAVLFEERVVIGRPDRQTPEFSDEMEHLVFNPTWYVPRSIATKDILPKLRENPAYLAESNMVLSRPDGGPMPFDSALHDYTAYTVADFPYRIRQRPDPANALGRVKFMFPNNHAIYLHDTPSRNLFLRDRRAYSSGCVRVRDPLRLAAILLAPQVADPEGYIQRLIDSGKERYVHLERTVPVHLTYRTATVDAFGDIRFRADVYGRDALVADALRRAGVALPEG
jgi:murein L,D-transpeptidase YcbB/YkuD